MLVAHALVVLKALCKNRVSCRENRYFRVFLPLNSPLILFLSRNENNSSRQHSSADQNACAISIRSSSGRIGSTNPDSNHGHASKYRMKRRCKCPIATFVQRTAISRYTTMWPNKKYEGRVLSVGSPERWKLEVIGTMGIVETAHSPKSAHWRQASRALRSNFPSPNPTLDFLWEGLPVYPHLTGHHKLFQAGTFAWG